MKLEKRGGDGETPVPQEPSSGKKPVVVYIMILFIVAFLLMALSFLMHQRSNSEVLGELQHSVSAMQEVQALQEQVIQLQKELAETKEQLEQEQEAAETAAAAAQAEAGALLTERDSLEAQVSELGSGALLDSLDVVSQEGEWTVTPPSERYLELKEAVEALKDRAP